MSQGVDTRDRTHEQEVQEVTEQLELNAQESPWPTELEWIIDNFKHRPGWRFNLRYIDRGQGSKGLTLIITTLTTDSYDEYDGTEETLIPRYRVNHYFPVPPAAYNRNSWMLWLLECLDKVDAHETREFFIVDGERPFAPHHSEGEDPYATFMIGDKETAQKKYTEK